MILAKFQTADLSSKTDLSLLYSEGVVKGRIYIKSVRRCYRQHEQRSYLVYSRKRVRLLLAADADMVIFDPSIEQCNFGGNPSYECGLQPI